MSQKLKVYSPAGHASSQYWHRFLVHPVRAFWGDGSDKWNEYAPSFEFYKDLFSLTEKIEEANAVFLPMSINYYVQHNKLDLVKETCDLAVSKNLKCYIWIEGDFDFKIQYNGAVYLKNASFRSRNLKNEMLRPGDVKEDLLVQHSNNKVEPLLKNQIATIGFDGLASYPPLRLLGLIAQNSLENIKTFSGIRHFDAPPIFPLLLTRNRILRLLESSKLVKTNFTKRKSFATGTVGKNDDARLEFIKNIRQSDYTLCIRGAANYSLRLYETLCLGRIPLLVDTACVLPCEDKINWKSLIPIIPIKDVKHIAEFISDYHSHLHPDEFIEKQIECRKIYETYFTNEKFATYVFNSIANSN